MALNLRKKILSSVVGVTLLSVSITAGAGLFLSYKIIKDEAISRTFEVANHNAALVKGDLDSAFDVARGFAHTFSSIKNTGKANRHTLNQILHDSLDNNKELLGTWTAWEPNALDGEDEKWVNKPTHDKTGRFVPYWYRTDGTINVEALKFYTQSGDGNYYLLAIQSGNETLLEPYIYPVGGKDTLITSLSVPLKENGETIAVTGVDFTLENIQRKLSAIKPFETGYLTLISNKGTIITHPNENLVGKNIKNIGFSSDTLSQYNKLLPSQIIDTNANGIDVIQVIIPLQIANTKQPWTLIVTVPKESIFIGIDHLILTIIFLSIFLAVISGGIAIKISAAISNPISALTYSMNSLAEGDFNADIPTFQRHDEIDEMAKALQVFKNNAIAVKSNNSEIFNAMQKADTLESFCKEVIQRLTPLSKSSYGVFSIYDEAAEKLTIEGVYGFDQENPKGMQLSLGEGIAGQCAKEKKPIVLANIPENYIEISSSLGRTSPNFIYATPLLLRGRVLGVIELASLSNFGSSQQQIIASLIPSIALSLENLQRILELRKAI